MAPGEESEHLHRQIARDITTKNTQMGLSFTGYVVFSKTERSFKFAFDGVSSDPDFTSLPDHKKTARYIKAVLDVFRITDKIEAGERYGYVIDTVGTDGNHVHVFCGAAPKESPARVANVLKSITARELLRRLPGLRKELWGAELWGDGYYVGTVDDGVTEESIKRYIENQGKEDGHERFEQMLLFKL